MPKTAPEPTENMEKNANYHDKEAKVNFSLDDIAIKSEIYDEDTYNYDEQPNSTIFKQSKSNEKMRNNTTTRWFFVKCCILGQKRVFESFLVKKS